MWCPSKHSLPCSCRALLLILATFCREGSAALESLVVDSFEPSSLHTLGRSWAERATQKVLLEVDNPSLDTIRTCEMVSMFWFASEEIHRAFMYFSKLFFSFSMLVPPLEGPPTTQCSVVEQGQVYIVRSQGCAMCDVS